MCVSEKKGLAVRGLIFAGMAVVFLLVFSATTSPLTGFYGGDSSFFLLVGQGMTRGMLPYRDFFDMKGPYLFLIEYMGQLICPGRTGAFVMQCVSLFCCLWVIDSINRELVKNLRHGLWAELLLLLPFLFIAAITFEQGNLTEEFSLPLLLLSLRFTIRYLEKVNTGSDTHAPRIGFFYGFAFGVLALIRITNACTIGACILTITVILVIRRKWRNLWHNAVAFLLGFASAFTPACCFYAAHGLLREMLSQVFLFGVQYSTEFTLVEKLSSIPIYMWDDFLSAIPWAALPMIVLVCYRVKDWKYWLLSVSLLGLFLLAVTMGNIYRHYFTLGLPNLVFGFALLTEQTLLRRKGGKPEDRRRGIVMAVILAVIFLPQTLYFRNALRESKQEIIDGSESSYKQQQIHDILSYIPEEEHDSIYVYGVEYASMWYAQAGVFPACRYCDWQEHYISLKPEIGEELESWICGMGPEWIVSSAGGDMIPEEIRSAVQENYSVYAQNSSFILYRAGIEENMK